MRQWIALAFLPVLLLGCDQQQAPTTLLTSSIEVYFPPNGGYARRRRTPSTSSRCRSSCGQAGRERVG